MGSRRPAPPVIPGQPCPAGRTAKACDPQVHHIRAVDLLGQEGHRTCGRCGTENIRVTQAIQNGVPLQAWYYDRHTVPERRR